MGVPSYSSKNTPSIPNGSGGCYDLPLLRSPKKSFNPFEKAFRPIEEDPATSPPDKIVASEPFGKAPQALRLHAIHRIQPPKAVEVVMLKDQKASQSSAELALTRECRQEYCGMGMTASEGLKATLIRQESRVSVGAQDGHHRDPTFQAPSVTESAMRATIRSIVPSLPTLEKATSTAVYFETLYWAILKPPKSLESAHHQNYMLSRERRRLALEEEMSRQRLGAAAKERARARWREEETWDLRQRRQKVNAKSFKKLKRIGHGE